MAAARKAEYTTRMNEITVGANNAAQIGRSLRYSPFCSGQSYCFREVDPKWVFLRSIGVRCRGKVVDQKRLDDAAREHLHALPCMCLGTRLHLRVVPFEGFPELTYLDKIEHA